MGEGSECATLAYAKNVDGKLVYEVTETTEHDPALVAAYKVRNKPTD